LVHRTPLSIGNEKHLINLVIEIITFTMPK
jgi:hypothetical protein